MMSEVVRRQRPGRNWVDVRARTREDEASPVIRGKYKKDSGASIRPRPFFWRPR